jgi:hypothetical protein
VLVLDFKSAEANARFAQLIKDAYNGTGGYGFLTNNCGHAFQRAINRMNLPGVPTNDKIKPSNHEGFINDHLKPYIRTEKFYPQDVMR